MKDSHGHTKLPEIEGLRGLSATGVLLYHGFGALAALGGVWVSRFGTGSLGAAVYVFFALSAYLLVKGNPARSWVGYYTHRVFRIFPVWLLILPLYVAAMVVPFTAALPFVAQNWFYWDRAIVGNTNSTWTLSIELAFYTAMPAWLWLLDRHPRMLLAGCSAATTATIVAWLGWGMVGPDGAGLALLSYATGSYAARGWLPRLGSGWATVALGLGFLVGLGQVGPIMGYDLSGIVVGVPAAFLIANPPAWLGRFAWLGIAAYPTYLLGRGVLSLLELHMSILPAAFLDMGLTVPIAFGISYGLERPLIRVGSAVAKRLSAVS